MLLLDSPTAQATTLARLDLIPLPEATKTWKPVRHSVLIRKAIDVFSAAFDMEPTAMVIGEARKGAQMFAKIDFGDKSTGEVGPSVAIRNALDKSLAAWVAAGANVFVCSNGCFSGDDAVLFRKHTAGIMGDLDRLFEEAAAAALGSFDRTVADLEAFRGYELTQDQGYAHLGILQGRGVMRPQEITEALRYWDDAPHAEHTGRNLFSLYQAANHGLKRAHPTNAAGSYTGLHAYARGLARPGMVIDVPTS